MSEQKQYKNIVRYGKSNNEVSAQGKIVVWEKIDGANASFKREGNDVICFSRNQLLTGGKDDSLGGFYQWVKDNIDVNRLEESCIYYGEWTTKHKIDYGQSHKKFYLFDVYDSEFETYLDLIFIRAEARIIGLELAPILYVGEYISEEHLQSFVGKSMLSVDGVGEGVVIKNYGYRDRHNNQVFTKIVSNHFQEINGGKIKEMKAKPEIVAQFIKKTVTHARIEKTLYKLVDEGKLKEDFAIEDMGTILKLLGSSVYDDVMKEEQDILMNAVKAQFGRAVPSLVRETLMIMGRA